MKNNVEIHGFREPSSMISRTLSTEAVKVANGVADLNTARPLVEYERRIATGELVDSDACQVGMLRELQRLYDKLIELADACKLDRYTAFEKAGRCFPIWLLIWELILGVGGYGLISCHNLHTFPLKVFTCMEKSAGEKTC